MHPPALKEERERERIEEEENEKEKETEREREKERRREAQEERWFVNIHYVCAEKGGKRRRETERKNGSETRDGGNIHAWKARAARKNLQPRVRVKDRQKRKSKKMCRRTNVVGQLN